MSDPLQLAPLFDGGAAWEPLLRPTLEALTDAGTFIGLREPDRARTRPFHGFLRLFLEALSRLQRNQHSLWRGVAKDLRKEYALGRTVTWWGVSSCTSKLQVAKGFLGSKGKRMLFEVKPRTAVSIKPFSAFTGEEELVLAPGTQLQVLSVRTEADGLCTVELEELDAPPRVS